MFIPLGHDRMTVRRWPVVTFALIAVCFVVFALTGLLDYDRVVLVDRETEEVFTYYAAHPYLQVPASAAAVVENALPLADRHGAPDDATQADEQEELEGLVARRDKAVAADPMNTFGYVPASPRASTLLTYQFFHVDFLHLLGNMWLLFLCGVFIEDRWGRAFFLAFFLGAGVVAALVFGATHPSQTGALVGASGAIAGLMGAFAIAAAGTEVRFLSLLHVVPAVVRAPAGFVLLFWGAFEGLSSCATPRSTTAHAAHVAGFALGMAVAALLRVTGLQRKIEDAVDVTAELDDDARLETAALLVKKGKAAEALAMLEGLAVELPENPQVHEAIARTARALRDRTREAAANERAAALREARR